MLTRFEQMIRLFVQDTSRPPRRLRELRVNTLRDTGNHPAPVIRVVDLLPRLDKLNIGFRNRPAVELLEILKCLLIVPSQQRPVPDTKDRPPGSRSDRRRRGRFRSRLGRTAGTPRLFSALL